jgi:hypothetical protein
MTFSKTMYNNVKYLPVRETFLYDGRIREDGFFFTELEVAIICDNNNRNDTCFSNIFKTQLFKLIDESCLKRSLHLIRMLLQRFGS